MFVIPKQLEESGFGRVGFNPEFPFSLASCHSAMVARSDRKFWVPSLPNSRFFKLFRYIFLLLISSSLFSNCAEEKTPPDFLSFAGGAFDLYREKHRTFEFEIEYKFHLQWLKRPIEQLQFRPLIGAMATAKGSFYGYLGINFDLTFFNHLLFAPGFAAGYYYGGKGKNLGYPLEFRSGVELAWQFSDWHRLGVHFYHLSNASLGHKNPGEESLVLFYDIPLVKGFPFINDN